MSFTPFSQSLLFCLLLIPLFYYWRAYHINEIKLDVISALLIIKSRAEAIQRTGYDNIFFFKEKRCKIKDGWYRKTTIFQPILDDTGNKIIPFNIKSYQEKAEDTIIIHSLNYALSESNILTDLDSDGVTIVRKTKTHIHYPYSDRKKHKKYNKLFKGR